MRNVVFVLIFTMILIIFLSTVMGALTDFKVALITNNRVETALIASGWGGFTYVDMEELAVRKELTSKEYRDITINRSSQAINKITELIRLNLNLNLDLSPSGESFLLAPLVIEQINIYNPEDLPVILKGREYNVTSIEIRVKVPLKVPAGTVKYFEKTVVVSSNSFLTGEQVK